MANIRILAVEDDPILAETLELLVEELGYLMIAVVDNSAEALRMHKATLPDLVLMDIQIKGDLNGIQVAEKMIIERSTPIIFITSLRDREVFEQAKQLGPHAFLNKPFDELSIQNAIELAIARIGSPDSSMAASQWHEEVVTKKELFVKVKRRLVKLDFDEVLWSEVEGKYVLIHTKEEKLELRISLKDLAAKLPAGMFVRVHRNYLVNLSKISDIDLERNLIKVGGSELPLGTSYRENVLNRISTLG
ncbi:MAG: response regulator transcription factor [Cyclobacteriaceae bacterium]